MLPLKIRFNQIVAIFQLVVGTIILLLALMIGDVLQLFMGSFFILLGILYVSNPALVITENEILIKNPLGMTMKRYPHHLNNVETSGNKIIVDGKKVFLAANFVIHGPDFKKFKDLLSKNLEEHLVD
jgi:hypothetical protein